MILQVLGIEYRTEINDSAPSIKVGGEETKGRFEILKYVCQKWCPGMLGRTVKDK